MLTKFGVLVRKNPTRAALIAAPVFFFGVTAVLTMSIIFKGAPSLNLDEMSEAKTAAAIVITSAVVAILSVIFWLPYVYAKSVKHDYTVRWYHFFMGPLLWSRKAPEDAHENAHKAVYDYRMYKEEHTEDHDSANDLEKTSQSAEEPTPVATPAAPKSKLQQIEEAHPYVL